MFAVIVIFAMLAPWTGLFLPLLGGMYWLSLILDVMLIHLTVAALMRQIDRRWIAVPLLCALAWIGYTLTDYEWAKSVQSRLAETGIPRDLGPGSRTIIVQDANPKLNADLHPNTFLQSQWAEASPTTTVFVDGNRFLLTSNQKCSAPYVPASVGVVEACYVREAPPTSGFRITETDDTHYFPVPDLVRFGGRDTYLKTFDVDWLEPAKPARHVGAIRVGTLDYADPVPVFTAGCFWDIDGSGLHCALAPNHDTLFVNESCDTRSFVAYERSVEALLGLPVIKSIRFDNHPCLG
jgi:hypothetical protein